MDFPDLLLPAVSIVHHSQEVFQATSCISKELLYIGSSWSSNLCSSMCRGPQEYIAYEFILTSPAVSHMSDSSNLDSFRDGLLYSCCFVGCCLQDLFSMACSILEQLLSSFFFICLVSIHMVHPYCSIDPTAAWKKLHFILWVRFDFHMTNSLSIAVHHAFVSGLLKYTLFESKLTWCSFLTKIFCVRLSLR